MFLYSNHLYKLTASLQNWVYYFIASLTLLTQFESLNRTKHSQYRAYGVLLKLRKCVEATREKRKVEGDKVSSNEEDNTD